MDTTAIITAIKQPVANQFTCKTKVTQVTQLALQTHNLDSYKDDDGEQQQQNSAIHTDVVKQNARVTIHITKQGSLRHYVCLGGEGQTIM